MDLTKCIHVGLNPPSAYSELRRSLLSEESSNEVQDLNENTNSTSGFNSPTQCSTNFNINVGRGNPNALNFKTSRLNSILKASSIGSREKSSDFERESNLGNLSSLSSYDFSKLGSNSTNKSLLSASSARKSVTFSSDKFPSVESLKVDQLLKESGANLVAQRSSDFEGDSSRSNKADPERKTDLMGVFRKVVKHVITVNRFKKTGSDFMSDFLGADGMENFGFGDYFNNPGSLNLTDSIAQEPLLNKGSTTSLCESQMNNLNRRNEVNLNVVFNKRLVGIRQKYQALEDLLDELDDPLKLIKNTTPLSTSLEDHVNTARLIHPYHLNYYPAKPEPEEEEEEPETLKAPEPCPEKRRILRMQDYPSLFAIFTNPKNGITSVL